jgi:uncharacterized membrane protein YfcA
MNSWQILLLFTAGLGAGFVDAVAGGGGLITVPVLLGVGLPPQLALGTNKLQAACGTSLAVFNYTRAHLIEWRSMRLVVAVTFAASVLGTLAVTCIDPVLVRRLIPWMLLAVGVYTLASPNLGSQKRPARIGLSQFALCMGCSLGFYDGFFGPGAGSFWTMAFVLLLGLDLRHATARTKAVNLASNLGSLAVFTLAGKVRPDIGLVMIVGQLIGARLGSRMVIARGTRFIRVIFITVVFALTLKLMWR